MSRVFTLAVRWVVLDLCVVALLTASTASATTDALWLNSAGGDWSAAENWSTSPVVPHNGVPTADSTYHAIFDRTLSPYSVSMSNLDVALDSLSIRGAVTVHQTRSAIELGTLNVEQGCFLLTDGGVLRADEIVVGGGLFQLFHGLIADAGVTGTIWTDGRLDSESTLLNVRLQDATIKVLGRLALQGSLDGTGTIELLGSGYVVNIDPVSIGPSVTVHVPRDADAAFGRAPLLEFHGQLEVDGNVSFGTGIRNHGHIRIHDGGQVNQVAMRHQDEIVPGLWSIASGGQLVVQTQFAPSPAADVTFDLHGPVNRPLIDARGITANGVVHVNVAPSYMPRSDRPIPLWRAQQLLDGEFSEIILDELPREFAWDSSQLASTGTLHINGPAPLRIAHTEFEEPPLNATSYVATPFSMELGFQNVFYLNNGGVPQAGVNDFTGERAFSFQSIDSETTFDTIPIADFANTEVDVLFSLSNTSFEFLDYIEVSVMDDRADAEPLVVTAALSEFTHTDVHRLSIGVPTSWTDVTIQVRTRTDSNNGAERLNLHTVNVLVLGMDTRSEMPGDFAVDGELNLDDRWKLDAVIARQINKAAFDLDQSGSVNADDRLFWIEQLWNSYVGDANLDGVFNSADFVSVFQHGQYEDEIPGNSTWETGDWSGDREFNTADLVLAFQRGGYEQGPRAGAQPVPEPYSLATALAAVAVATIMGFGKQSRWNRSLLNSRRGAYNGCRV